MTDYRAEFYGRYEIAVGARQVDQAYYDQCARQFGGRWGAWLPPDKDIHILDIGCGYGEFLYFLRSLGYRNIVGLDLCKGELNVGRSMGLPHLIEANAMEYLQDKKDAFDVIGAFNFFEHLRKDEILHVLHLIHQSLKPGGRLLAVTPNGLSPFGGATRYWDFSHETGFTPASWRQLARIVGFVDIVFEEYGPIPHSLSGRIRTILWSLVRLGLKLVAYIEVGGPRDISCVYTADMKVIAFK